VSNLEKKKKNPGSCMMYMPKGGTLGKGEQKAKIDLIPLPSPPIREEVIVLGKVILSTDPS
jgi:hypothetical protein